jgi:hypothetical protein
MIQNHKHFDKYIVSLFSIPKYKATKNTFFFFYLKKEDPHKITL